MTNLRFSSCDEKLELAKQALQEYERFVERVQEGPRQVCVVLQHDGANIYTVALHGSVTQAMTSPNNRRRPDIGEMWWFVNGVIVEDVSGDLPPVGPYFTVSRILSHGSKDGWPQAVEIDAGGERRTVLQNEYKVEVGDQVLLDPSGLTVQYVRAAEEDVKKLPEQKVTWDQIGGLHEAKQALRDAVELPHRFPEIFRAYQQKPTKGVLLLGPPGCGKTMLGKAVASSLAETHGKLTPDSFIYVKGPEVLSKWVGEAEATIRSLFSRARKHKAKYGFDSVIFIDEADALLSARGTSIGTLSHTVVPQFLSELDGLEESGAVLLLATNRPHALDSAVTREGRVNRKIQVTRPDRETSAEILRIHVGGMPVQCEPEKVLLDLLWSDDFPLAQLNTDDGPVQLHLRHTVSGAMLAGLVQRSKNHAIRRDLKQGYRGGVSEEDLRLAIQEAHLETKSTRLDEVIQEVASSSDSVVMSVSLL